MHTKSIREFMRPFLLLSCVLTSAFASGSASAEFRVLHRFEKDASLSGEVAAFHELNSPDRILILGSNGRLLKYSLETDRVVETSQVRFEEGCEFGRVRWMKWASPFFLGKISVCALDVRTGRLSPAPNPAFEKGTYGSIYLGETESAVQFLINGRPWPKGGEGSGFVSVLEINKTTRQSSIRPLYTGVPGFSGGMAIEGDSLFVTAWIYETASSRVYTLKLPSVQSRVQKQETARFMEEASRLPLELKGNTGLLRVNAEELFYDNPEEEAAGESFRVNRKTGEVSPAGIPPADCRVIGSRGSEWLMFCGRSELRIGRF